MYHGGLIGPDDNGYRHRSIAIGPGNDLIPTGWKKHFFGAPDSRAVIIVDGLQEFAIRGKNAVVRVHSPIGEIVEVRALVVSRENHQRAGGAGA
jgi:phosphopantetheine adenylyltransferase